MVAFQGTDDAAVTVQQRGSRVDGFTAQDSIFTIEQVAPKQAAVSRIVAVQLGGPLDEQIAIAIKHRESVCIHQLDHFIRL